MASISEQRKAILSAVVALATGAAVALQDNVLTLGEGATVVAGAVVAYAGVYGIRNKPGTGDEDPGDGGPV